MEPRIQGMVCGRL